MPLKSIHKIVKLFNSEVKPNQLAWGISFGMMVGLTPLLSLHNLISLLVVCLFRINFLMFFLSLGLFSVLSFLLRPFFDWFGYLLLVDMTALRSFWIFMTTGPVVPFFRFNNTVMTGSFFLSLALFFPLFILIVKFRQSKPLAPQQFPEGNA
ncbi:MAG: hypothetical protein JWQ35_1414 [Bacteriovoracaceae bacterium]|nr:hypothetical protein [Bacteriovoracaceae bacterium]